MSFHKGRWSIVVFQKTNAAAEQQHPPPLFFKCADEKIIAPGTVGRQYPRTIQHLFRNKTVVAVAAESPDFAFGNSFRIQCQPGG
ncbi:MAG: hypothetical protein IJZ19_14210 [Lentisphaeria bacterium]|nr:hypothetical protein [Lentisphaeria bacterium]